MKNLITLKKTLSENTIYINKKEEFDIVFFVKETVKIVRKSYEYKKFIKYLKSSKMMNECAILENMNTKNSIIEIHHYPLTLFDITFIVANHISMTKLDMDYLKLSPFLVAKEVIDLHYNEYVGLIPLSKTVHELSHSGLILDYSRIRGNYQKFLLEYNSSLTGDSIDTLFKNKDLGMEEGDNIAKLFKVNMLDTDHNNELILLQKIEEYNDGREDV